MFRLMTISMFAVLQVSAWPARADTPPNCGPNKVAKNALECVCVAGALPQPDGSCKRPASGSGNSGHPYLPPSKGPDIPVKPISPSCGAAACPPSVFYVPENPVGDPRIPEDDASLTTDDLNLLQHRSLMNRMLILQDPQTSTLTLQKELGFTQ